MFCRKHESQKFNAKKCRSSASFRDDSKAAIDSLVVFTYSMVIYATLLTQNIFCRIRETVFVSDFFLKSRVANRYLHYFPALRSVSLRLEGGNRFLGSFYV